MGKQILNGVVYGTGEIIHLSPNIYSEEEKEIGVWIDGKPLYEKTTFFSSPINLTQYSWTVIYDMASLNPEKIVKIVPYAYSKTAPLNPFGLFLSELNSSKQLRIVCVQNWVVAGVTVQYTKTTDTPWSGKYTSDGTMAYHYNANEKVIGTWFGQPLYEKTVQLTLTPGSNTTAIPHGITGISRVVDYDGSLFDSVYGTDKTCKMSQSVYNSSTSTGMTANATYCANLHYVDATNVMYSLGSAYHSNAQLYLTVRYTKSL